jgi:hypothetical protein
MHIFPDEVSRAQSISDRKIGEHEIASRIVESSSESGDAETLAGSSAHENVD